MATTASPTAWPNLRAAESVIVLPLIETTVPVSLLGAVPTVTVEPTLKPELSATGTSVEPIEAPGAATDDAPAPSALADTGTTVQ